jgi:hypothetical protein
MVFGLTTVPGRSGAVPPGPALLGRLRGRLESGWSAASAAGDSASAEDLDAVPCENHVIIWDNVQQCTTLMCVSKLF